MQRLHRLLPLLLAATAAGADQDPWYSDVPPEPWGEEATQKEAAVVVPPFPRGDDLLALDTEFEGYRYFIDPRSVSIADFRIVRYSVVVESPGGVRNVLYEGIQCGSREYKTYAHATGDGPFRESASPGWRPIRGGTAFVYRRDLQEFYFCDGLSPRRKVDDIIRRIKYRRR